MDKFTDCTKHDAQSAAKLYNLEYVHGTRDAEIHPGFFVIKFIYNQKEVAGFNFLSSLALDSSELVHLSQTLSVTV